MTFRLLWSIVRVNFKKNWVMILSFFAFLLISFSIVFGLTSFATGLHNEMPAPIFQSQKYETYFLDTHTYWDAKTNDNNNGQEYKTDSYSEYAKDEFVETFNELAGVPNPDATENRDLVKRIVNYDQPGNLWGFLRSKNWDPKDNQPGSNGQLVYNAMKKLLSEWSNTNLVSYTLSQKIFPKVYEGMDVWDWTVVHSDKYAGNSNEYYYLLDNSNPNEKEIKDEGVYSSEKYVNTDNAIFVSPDTAKRFKYRLGQKIPVTLDGGTQEFTYGGSASYITTMATSGSHNSLNYYLLNYKPYYGIKNNERSPIDFRLIGGNQYDSFLIRDLKGPNDKTKQYNNILSIAKNTFISSESSLLDDWGKSNLNFNVYIVYIGMTMFSVVIGIIMLVLDIVVAWFLIRETIRSLSTQLLFLKTLGMSDNEASMITSTTLFIVMILAVGLSFIGMLGIQALFISITGKFIDEYNHWADIKPFSLVIIFGIVIVMIVIYILSTLSLLKNIDLTSNSTFSNSGSGFKKLRGALFDRSVNMGLTFSFTMKNMKKIIATFCIAGLVTMLSFIAIGFDTGISRGIDNTRKFVNYKETSSSNFGDGYVTYLSSDDYNNKGFIPPIKDAKKVIEQYDTSSSNEDNLFNGKQDITQYLDNSVKGKYITRQDFSKIINDTSTVQVLEWKLGIEDLDGSNAERLQREWNSALAQYDKTVSIMWPGADRNFTIDLGAVYSGGLDKETSYQLNDYLTADKYRGERIIILNDNDKRAKEIFSDKGKTSVDSDDNEFIIPCAVGSRYEKWNQIDDGDLSYKNTNIDFHLFMSDGKDVRGAWPNNNAFHLQYYSSSYIAQGNEVYVKQSDFTKLLNYFITSKLPNQSMFSNAANFYKLLINEFENGEAYNTYLNDGLPLSYRQFSVQGYRDDNTLLGYLKTMFTPDAAGNSGLRDTFTNAMVSYYKVTIDTTSKMLTPIMNAMIVILILIICLAVAFIVFMVMSIMNENDDIIFILKALGYQRGEILWRMTAGYMVAIWISVVIGIIVAAIILAIMNNTFEQILYMGISLKFSGPVAGLFFALMIALPLFIIWISASKIEARNLTTLDRE